MRAPRQTALLDQFLVVRLATAGTVARRELDRECRAGGRPLREALLLAAASEQRLRPATLADRIGLQRSEVTRAIHDLAYEGWVELTKHPYDGRSYEVRLHRTEPIVQAAASAFAAVDRRARVNLTPLRQRQLAACLEALKGPRTPVADALAGI